MMEVKRIDPSETRPLRHLVLWPHIERMEDCVIDIDHREDAIHLGTFDNGRIVSVGSLFRMTSPKIDFPVQYRLRAMATDPEYRGKNGGAFLIREAERILREMNIDVLWCDARIGAVGFYQKLGFSLIDEIYDVPRIGPHKFMYLVLRQQ
jgi:GNAT superfamily N-acetyltransferase